MGRDPGIHCLSTALIESLYLLQALIISSCVKPSTMDTLLAGEAAQLTRKAIELALAGDTQALRLCLDRLMPPGKDRVVFFDFPPIRSVAEIPQGMVSVMAAISQGKVMPPEGALLSQMLVDYAKAMTASDVERRLQKLEQSHPVSNPQLLDGIGVLRWLCIRGKVFCIQVERSARVYGGPQRPHGRPCRVRWRIGRSAHLLAGDRLPDDAALAAVMISDASERPMNAGHKPSPASWTRAAGTPRRPKTQQNRGSYRFLLTGLKLTSRAMRVFRNS